MLISLVYAFLYKYMSCLWSLMWSNCARGSWYLIYWKYLSRGQEWTSEQLLFQTDFRKWLFATSFLGKCFQNYPDSVILQKCLLLSRLNFKHNLIYICYLMWLNRVYRSWYLTTLLDITVQNSTEWLLFQIDIRKWLFVTLLLGRCFQNHPDSITLNKWQTLFKPCLKQNSAHMLSLNLTHMLSFEPMFIITTYYIKSKRF